MSFPLCSFIIFPPFSPFSCLLPIIFVCILCFYLTLFFTVENETNSPDLTIPWLNSSFSVGVPKCSYFFSVRLTRYFFKNRCLKMSTFRLNILLCSWRNLHFPFLSFFLSLLTYLHSPKIYCRSICSCRNAIRLMFLGKTHFLWNYHSIYFPIIVYELYFDHCFIYIQVFFNYDRKGIFWNWWAELQPFFTINSQE